MREEREAGTKQDDPDFDPKTEEDPEPKKRGRGRTRKTAGGDPTAQELAAKL